jgi:hypothetical protein
MEPNLSQALHLLNGDTVNQKVEGGGVIAKMLKEKKPPEEIAKDLYVRCLTREPTPAECANVTAMLKDDGAEPRQVLTDLFWALLNSQEFMFNH